MLDGAIKMDSRVDAWKKKLLDLGKKNRLLNYRDTKRGSIRIVAPDSLSLWQTFVEDEKPIVFPYINEEAELNSDDDGDSFEVIKGDVETNKTPSEQQKTLRALRNKAQSFISEQGVNALYLAFGLLTWTESASSKQVIQSPLILVPVSLQWESITSPFVLQLHDDEIVVNPTLAYKMENDFGITMPSLETGKSPEAFFNELDKRVASQGWHVDQAACLTLLSFLKINMYYDLENHREAITEHPVVRAIAGDTSGLTVDVSDLDGYDHDANTAPSDSYLVVDADASQMDAIECAKKGASFVLQGPPGTGKSQTITNIIAESLAAGKKVLFVSEKMAALDVVYRRLKDAGLDDFALVLHSHKANKKDVLEQLGRSLALSGKHVKLADEAQKTLDRLLDDRQRLNDYSSQLHEVIEPLHKSIFEANGKIAEYGDVEDVAFSIEDVGNVTSDRFRHMYGALKRYSSVLGSMHGAVTDNPWYDTMLTVVANEFRHDLSSKAADCKPKLESILALVDEATSDFGLKVDSLPSLQNAIAALESASCSPKALVSWIENGDLDNLDKLCKEQLEQRNSFRDILASIEGVREDLSLGRLLPGNGVCLPNSKLSELLGDYTSDLDRCFSGDRLCKEWRGKEAPEHIETVLAELDNRINALKATRAKSSSRFSSSIEQLDFLPVQQRFSAQYDESFLSARCRYLEDCAALKNVAPVQSSVLRSNRETLLALEKAYKIIDLRLWAGSAPELAELADVEGQIAETCESEIDRIPYNDIYLRYKTACSSFTKLFNSQYKADRSTVGAMIKGLSGKPSDDQVLSVLGMLRRRDELRSWRDSSSQWVELCSLEAELHDLLDEAVFNLDYKGMFHRYRDEYDEAFEKTYSQYEEDLGLFSGYAEPGVEIDHKSVADEIALLADIAEKRQWLEANDDSLRGVFGERYLGEETDLDSLNAACHAFKLLCRYDAAYRDALSLLSSSNGEYASLEEKLGPDDYIGLCSDWDGLIAKIEWARELSLAIETDDATVTKDFISRSCEDPDFAAHCADLKLRIQAALESVKDTVAWFSSQFEAESDVAGLPVARLLDKLVACSENLVALEEVLDYRKARLDCDELGLGECIAALDAAKVHHDSIIPVFEKRFLILWLDSVLPSHPAVASFRHRTQEELIKEFRSLDQQQMKIARTRVKANLVDKLPSLDRFTSGHDDVHVLQREMGKKRKIMPLRQLFNAIPGLITTLKPCLMMSPLSVSLFLESDLYRFDTVIFDEASQVCTENAIGAMFRGKQVIIAGDSKQLPPSNFFAASNSDDAFDSDEDEGEETYDSGAFESVLDEASMLPERTLLWHYRSRHEHLIAFSNAKIYRNRLVTFPSSIDRAPDFGVGYEYVPTGFYDRGGRRGNVPEAERVAELVFDHFRRNPGRSLGVITFGSAQENAIDAAIRKMRLQNQEFEQFFNEDVDEPFFIKSLENVQGDERDTIIFSIGYAKDVNGVMKMLFGPLSQSGGERRLNVAITRAKYNIKLVGSIRPTDIATERVSADGPKLLKSYIDFAENGPEVLEHEATASDAIELESPFEESVLSFLSSKGYGVATQVGCSGYRIDMAVKHPELHGRYVLGIECDGATYHSARTARERDRLRQDVLESMGWNIYRIWSTDWIKDSAAEGQRLVDAIEKAISEYVERWSTPQHEKQTDSVAHVEQLSYEIVEDREPTADEIENPYGFDKMEDPDFKNVSKDWTGHPTCEDCIDLLVKRQFPIHKDVVAQKLCFLFGKERAGKVVKEGIARAVSGMDSVVEIDDFLYPREYERIPAYGSCGRPIKHISLDELCSAMLLVFEYHIGMSKDALIEATARAYEFKRIGANIEEALGKAYDKLLEDDVLHEVDGRIVANENE